MGDIEFELCGKQFVAAKKTTSNGKPTWRYPEVDENELKEIDALANELPDSISIDGKHYQFGPGPQKGNDPTATSSLSRKREVRTSAVIEDKEVEIHTRATKRRNGKWFFWLRIDPKRRRAPQQPAGSAQDAPSTGVNQLSPLEQLKSVFPKD